MEPELEGILAMMVANLAARQAVERELVGMVRYEVGRGAVELVSSIVHLLRWPVVRE
jgi:hypothetical protein